MSSSRMGTNGASLEDCHTNVFALTELNGLKWKCVTTPTSHRGWISIDQDPVLSAYAKCLQAGILCAWRRQPSQMHNTLAQIPLPDYRIDVVKELWVFWYSQDEPELLAQYTSHLACGENGRGNWATAGIPYEIRTLYFKALHNLIERSLIKSGYVRIGRYFVRPYDVPSSDRVQCLPSYILGISFNFFVHGENIVCTCVNVQKQPAIFRLSLAHLELRKRQPIILGPWSLRAQLIPRQSEGVSTSFSSHSWSATDQAQSKLNSNVKMEYIGEVTPFDNQQARPQGFFDYDGTTFSHQDANSPKVEKLWSDWELFFGLCNDTKPPENSMHKLRPHSFLEEVNKASKKLPKMVLVDVDGVRMWFPSSLIVVQATDDLLLRNNESESSSEEQEATTENPKQEVPENFFPEIAVNSGKLSNDSSLSSSNVSPSLLRKKRRKRLECRTQRPTKNYRNIMFSSMVNGSRAAQRYLEEACILPSYSRRRESTDTVLSTKSDDETKWNLTDGLRGAECDTEQHSCCPCHLENPLRTPIPSTSAGSHYGSGLSSRGSPCSKMFCGDESVAGRLKGSKLPYHQRSSTGATFPSPPRSPTFDRKLERGSPDWIYDYSSRNSSLGGTKGRSDSFDEVQSYSESSIDYGSHSPVYRRVFKPTAASINRHGSSSEENKTRRSSVQFFTSEFGANSLGYSQVIMPSSSLYQQNSNIQKDSDLSDTLFGVFNGEMKCFVPKRRTKKNRSREKRKIGSNNTIGALDMLFMTTGRKEDWKYKEFSDRSGSGFNFGIDDFGDNSRYKEVERTLNDSYLNAEMVSSKEAAFGFSSITSRSFGSVYDGDLESHASFVNDCSPSTVAMMDTESIGVTDSVHLSPPASNERVEPISISSTLSGPVANNLLARVGGPPSVGDYKIYPTPPSVDAIQTQQFSPQNVVLQTNSNPGFYASTMQCIGMNQSSANISLCHPLPSQKVQNPANIIDQFHENLMDIKNELDGDPPYGLQGKFISLLAERLPLFGKTIVLKVVLCGKYGPDYLKDDLAYSKSVFFDKRRQALLSFATRTRRKHITATPLYHPFREEHKTQEHKLSPFERARAHFGPSVTGSLTVTSGNHGTICMTSNNSSGSLPGVVHGMVSSPVGSINPALPMRPSRPQSLTYATPSVINQHNSGFLSPTAYGASNLINSTNQLSNMHSNSLTVTPQGLGMIPNQSTSMMGSSIGGHSGINIIHSGINSQQQQAFQQLSQFVNNATFSNQQSNLYGQQQFYQQQILSRGTMQANMTPQVVQSPTGYPTEPQVSTPLEPPPSFSQAVSSQYANSGTIGSSGSSVYGQSPQMMRPGSFMNSASSPIMLSASRPVQNSMLLHSSANSSLPSTMYHQRPSGVPQSSSMSNISTPPQFPEGNSLALAVLLQDTVLDLHYDSAFDACPLCSCNGNIRTKELGMYVTPPEVLRQSSSLQNPIVNRPTSGFYINSNATQNCNCGFSAVRHRYLSMKAGLFPEDAKEATDITDSQNQPVIPHTIWFDPISKKDIDFIALLCEQTLVHDLSGFLDHVSLFTTQCQRAVQGDHTGANCLKKTEYIVSDVDQRELPLVFQAACEVACMEMNCRRPRRDFQSVLWHDWGVQIANEMYEPREAECLAVLHEIGPVLEETLRKARSAQMGGSNNIVEGPLTWRHFDRKSLKTGGGIEDDSLPEPIPNILMASEKDAISASPQTLRMWEKMLLEPYDQPKDVLYIAVVPDNNMCIEKSKKYFEDLSRLYEQCRFGRHLPFAKDTLRDGFLRVPTRVPITNPNDFLKQVERHINNGASLIAKLNAYMQFVENELSEVVNKNSYIFSRESYRALLMEHQVQATVAASVSTSSNSTASTIINEQMPPPALPASSNASHAEGSVSGGGISNVSGPSPVNSLSCNVEPLAPTNISTELQNQTNVVAPPQIPEQIAEGFTKDEPGTLPHVIVLYLVNPFLMGADESPLVARVVTVALMRAFTALLDHIDLHHRPQLQMEIIGLQTILDYCGSTIDILKDECGQLNGLDQGRMEKTFNERLSSMDAMKTVAFSVYSQSRILLPEVVSNILPTSMTRFGPASAMSDLLEKLRKNDNPVFYKVPSKPFVLAPPPPVVLRPNNELMQISTEETVLFVSYCLIGLDFLAAAVTDHQGHLLDNCLINLRVKPDHKRGNLRYKQSTQIRDSLYRLWSYILGTLATGTKNWRLVIGKVGRIGHGEFKFWTQLLSKSYLKQVPSRMKQACRPCHQMPGTAEVPGVLSACLVSLEPEAYLRVFPSSFQHDERFAKNARYRVLNTPDDASCTHILVFPTSPELNLDHQGGAGGNDYDDLSIMLESELPEEFSAIIKSEDLNPNTTGQSSSMRITGNTGIPTEYTDVFENQPLAAGYYISTAPASELPEWFWSSCPSAKRRNPVHLKSSLHLNTNNVQQGDDITLSAKGSETCQHQLDSQSTVDVLRYVLETYNALSWLNVDLVTGERRSCLPVHIQALMRLCNTVDRLIN